MQDLLDFLSNDGILNIPGNKYIKNGVIKEIPKPDDTSISR